MKLKIISIFIVAFLFIAIHFGSMIPGQNIETDNSLIISTFLGGSGNDGMFYTGINIKQDTQGNIFIAGTTTSNNFPVTTGIYSGNNNGESDIFITKFNHDLTEVLASTYIGGKSNEEARALTIDHNGNLYISGITESVDFPVSTNAFQNTYSGGTESPYGSGDAFVIKMSNDLSTLIASTFLGGNGHETCSSICVDTNGNVIVSGSTSSPDFPVSNDAFNKDYKNGGNLKDDVFISKLSPDLSELIASTYINGKHDDFSEALSIDSSNDIIIAGWTASSDYPTTSNAYDKGFSRGYYDGFISKLDSDLSTLKASTFLGGTNWDFCYGLTLDSSDNIFVTGHTASNNYPTTIDAYCRAYQGSGGAGGGDDVFISKLSNNLSMLHASTFLGGNNWEIGYTLSISEQNILYVSGCTSSLDFPTLNSFSDTFQGGSTHYGDLFISCLTTDLSYLLSSTYLGGLDNEDAGQTCIDSNGEIIVAGATSSSDCPVIGEGYDASFNGESDVFLSKFKTGLTNNIAPEKPSITGPTSGKIGQTYEYQTETTDSDDDLIYYLVDWGDETQSEWYGPFASGEPCQSSHVWSEENTYEIKVKAKDIFGFETGWSEPLIVSMPKHGMRFESILKIFENLPFYRLLEHSLL